jgi:hypothetical protein
MSAVEMMLFVSMLLVCVMAQIGVNAAYRNGVRDGAGAVDDPNHPGYAKAAQQLQEEDRNRWDRLREKMAIVAKSESSEEFESPFRKPFTNPRSGMGYAKH